MKITKYLVALLAGGLMTSCGEDFLNDMDSSTVTSDQIDAAAKEDADKVLSSQLKGCYTNWTQKNPFSSRSDISAHMSTGFGGIMLLSDMMSNDISLALGSGDPWRFDHNLDYNGESYIRATWPWTLFYTVIASANDVIDIINADDATTEMKQMLGQAYAFRGVSHFYLAQFYQKTYVDAKEKLCVPLRLSGKETSIDGRATVEQVYTQVEADLKQAIELLDGFKRSDKQTIDKQVAEGFLARVYLVMNRWDDAATMANAARQGYTLNTIAEAEEFNYQDLSNHEVMWGWQPTESTKKYYASWASWRSLDGPGYGGTSVGCIELVDAALYASIDDNDVRKSYIVSPDEATESVPALASYKFPFVSQWLGDVVYMRSAEMYLIEAEALLKGGKSAQAASVMDELLSNRIEGYTSKGSWTADDLYAQRRIELWGEGFAYFDCVRLTKDLIRNYTGTNEPAGTRVNVPGSSYKWIYQIPKTEITNSDAISDADQNPVE